MDQNSFRSLLNTPAASTDTSKSKAYSRGSLLASGSSQAKKPEPSDASFKPRKVKKPTDSKYRDRASERRGGGANEYAEVEGILKDFEEQTAGEDKAIVEERRRYLGGDATHTVLVKGLDFALLEQNRAREETREDLDDDLESAFLGNPATTVADPTSSDPPAAETKKRTRTELLAELQRSRVTDDSAQNLPRGPTREEELQALERAKQAGKFKPMGASSFAPVEKKKKKKKKVVFNAEGKLGQVDTKSGKGKEKELVGNVDNTQLQALEQTSAQAAVPPTNDIPAAKVASTNQPSASAISILVPTLASKSLPSIEDIEDIDPFADAGDYQPDYGDDSDAEGEKYSNTQEASLPPSAAPVKHNWFNEPEPEPIPLPLKPPTPHPQSPTEMEEHELEKPMRLGGLSSSAIPSISEFLAMDKEEEEREKKRARKEKKKKGGG